MQYRGMTVAQLRRRLADFPDDAPVLVPREDHSFRSACADCEDVVWEPDGRQFAECAGDETLDQKTTALVIR